MPAFADTFDASTERLNGLPDWSALPSLGRLNLLRLVQIARECFAAR
ncbi:MAG: hypothetical protein ACI8RZ_005990 [Myxococcota bacterium]|jgi:hypothetical protein